MLKMLKKLLKICKDYIKILMKFLIAFRNLKTKNLFPNIPPLITLKKVAKKQPKNEAIALLPYYLNSNLNIFY